MDVQILADAALMFCIGFCSVVITYKCLSR